MPTRRFRPRLARFGEFELDIRAGELRRSGVPVRLQEQPLRILTMLLEHPGEVVLRDEIRKRLWPNDTAVEIGHGINAAVLRLREALGESAENPRFIQTLPRRGYRFCGEVEWENGSLTVAGITAVQPATPPPAADLTGQTVSHYRILARLGSGGMGVVYRAEDLHLGRHVALKFLSREFAGDPEAREWFLREARAASALNHPHVCTVYGVEECSGQPVISMELVEGETLSAVLSRAPLLLAEALTLAIQVAGALDAAHRKGVVHRDLKPGNLMVTGAPGPATVKVLDFGIAKMDRPASRPIVASGIVGTPHYMSPEQQQGHETGGRSDIYSFGVVLFEMLTGRRRSADESLPTGFAPGVRAVVERCVALDPRARFQTAAELQAELERQFSATLRPAPVAAPVGVAVPVQKTRGIPLGMVLGVASAAILIFLAVLPWGSWQRAQAKAIQMMLTGPMEATGMRLKLSPDGRSLSFLSGNRHYVRSLEGPDIRVVNVPEGMGTAFWSPDGRSLAIPENGQLLRVGLAPGSTAEPLGRVNTNAEGAWGRDGSILIGMVGDGIYRIPATGGAAVRVTTLDPARGETRHLLPQFLPDGRRFLFVAGSNQPGRSALWAGSLDSPERKEVMPIESNFVFVPTQRGGIGYLLYLRDRVLVAQGFDSARLAPVGVPFPLGGAVTAIGMIGAAISNGDFSATDSVLTYRGAGGVSLIQNWQAELRQLERPAAKVSEALLKPPM